MELEKIIGKYQRKIDEKGRLSIPSELSKYFGNDFVYLKLNEDSVYFLPNKFYKKLIKKFSKLDLDDSNREFFSSIYKIDIKKPNRITMPREVLDKIKKNKVILLGIGDAIKLKLD